MSQFIFFIESCCSRIIGPNGLNNLSNHPIVIPNIGTFQCLEYAIHAYKNIDKKIQTDEDFKLKIHNMKDQISGQKTYTTDKGNI